MPKFSYKGFKCSYSNEIENDLFAVYQLDIVSEFQNAIDEYLDEKKTDYYYKEPFDYGIKLKRKLFILDENEVSLYWAKII